MLYLEACRSPGKPYKKTVYNHINLIVKKMHKKKLHFTVASDCKTFMAID